MHRNIDCSDAEWTARQDLAACYRIFDWLGWSEWIYNHISLRVPGENGAFLINPFGLLYSEACASNLVKIDIDGKVLDGSAHPVNQAGFVQHSHFHRHLGWAHAICHVHTTEIMAVCSIEGGLQPSNFYSAAFAGQLGYHDFEGITVRPEEGERLRANLGDKRVLMLRNHGSVVLAESIGEMLHTQWALQRACEIQLAAQSMGQPLVIADEVIAVHQRDLAMGIPAGSIGAVGFEAWKRQIDRADRTWRD